MYELLAQEPWCWHPDQIARVTDYQIERLYQGPAKRRAEAFDRPGGGSRRNAPGPVADPFANGLPRRADFVLQMQVQFKGTEKHWGGVWDRMKAQLDAKRGRDA